MKGFPIVASLPLFLLALPCAGSLRGAAHVEGVFRDADANRDGVITEAESHVATAREFREHDLDGNGVWSASEVRRQQLDAGASQLAVDDQARVFNAVLTHYDIDRDGRITLDNYQQAQLRMLREADVNRDGQVTLQEALQLHGVSSP